MTYGIGEDLALTDTAARKADMDGAEGLILLAQTWGFEIEWDAPIGRRWEWWPRLLRIGSGFSRRGLVDLRRLCLRRLLSGQW